MSVRPQTSLTKQHQRTAGSLTRSTVSDSTEDRAETSAAALNLTTSSIGSINMSVDIDGTTYTGRSWSCGETHASCQSQYSFPACPVLLSQIPWGHAVGCVWGGCVCVRNGVVLFH